MDVASVPPNPVPQCFTRRSGYKCLNSSTPSSLALCCRYRYSNVRSGYSTSKHASHGTMVNFAPQCISCPSEKQASTLCVCPGQKVNFNRPYLFDNSASQNKNMRHPIVRSELAETGMSGTSYPFSAYNVIGKVRGICFYAVTAVTAIFLFQFMLVAHPFVLMFDRYKRKAQHFIARIWSMWTVSPFYKIQIQGWENLPPADAPAVYVSNHQSFLDIYTLLTLGRSFKFISKTEIFLFPIIGWAMYMMGTIPLRRMDARSQLETFKRCMDLIKKGASVFFFPEGTRSKDGKLGAFKKGAFSVAAKTKVPVVPITLIGTGHIMPAGNESTVNSGSVKVIIHKPIEGSDADALCNEARSIISRELIQHC